jgi:DNA-binding SARP family transcriptional activator/tetratricopeptide (TPR) repeat protein
MGELELRFLGEFKVIRDGQGLPLPPSKKTRALLAYLCLNRKRFRREQLCDLLWEIPDDPRGSLRWSLSKLRRLLDDDERPRILADRSSVGVDIEDLAIDVTELLAATANLKDKSTSSLESAAARLCGNFLEDLELSGFHRFHSWCVAEREQVARAQAALLRELVRRLEDSPQCALSYARALAGIAPYDEPSRAALIRLLHASQHMEEANQQYRLGMRMLKEAGIVPTGAMLEALRGISGDTPQSATVSGSSGAKQPSRPPPSGDELVGREDEWRRLVEAMAGAVTGGAAATFLLCGEPGIGKTHMLRCVAQHARRQGALVLESSAFESEGIRPFALWIDALRSSDTASAERIFGGSDLRNRDRLFDALSTLVAAATRPVLLVFDDVQWCDESSAAALHYVVRMNRRRALFVVLAARDGELQDNAPLQHALGGLRHDGLLEELRLPPLSDGAISRLIALSCPGASTGRLTGECRGNPLLAIELARAVHDGSGSGSLQQLVRERLSRFDVDGAEVLRWASVLNPRVDVTMLARLTGLTVDAVTAILESAERQAILWSTARGLRFSHELIARSVYADLSPLRRQVMHRRIAELLEEDTAVDLARASDLAHHASLSGDVALAAKAMVSAARLSLRFFANDEAMSLARKGLELAQQLPPCERVCVDIDLHNVVMSAAPLADWEDAACRYAALAEEALDHGALAHARRGYDMAAYVRWAHGHWDGAREQSLQSERAARGGSEEEHVVGLAETAKCLAMLERDLPQADAMLMEASSRAARNRIRHQSIAAGLGMLRFYENRLDEAAELLKEARTLCKGAGDRVNEFQANEYLVMIDIQRGLFGDARSRCDELLAIGSKLRGGSEAPFASAMQGLCIYALDDEPGPLDAALHELRIADAKHRLAYVQTRGALLDCERGRLEDAIARAGEALACAELLERPTEMMLAHVVLGRCHQALKQAGEARRHQSEVARLQASGVAAWARDMAADAKSAGRRRHG